ncbi:DEAD/DEAH box helicase [Sporolactobacillus terrae]|uniref:Helicase n=1 Tax=Sporolactobacillus terrae TaxID=269673 RepID=A0A410D9H3_9BACL|nr:SNF2-related protein [Sporolactobacillus terrae]QAA22747.1 ATP-dependent helicase [Sporolactobacillus terrae]QAA25720.1 ATP-dependent helicase [Sporolactobacillus terrae]UAK17532.1 DEAD/DEAH box helicase [Sporolactobacillus terrae]BBN99083.1 helicase [Sporolactobacillus terrae]
MKPIIHFDRSWYESFFKHIEEDGPWAKSELFSLAYLAEQARTVPTFHGLIAPSRLPLLKPHPHQVETARIVIEEMHGKAILADEVGLGKTIEAGLIIKEYMIRGLVKKVLILVPASLVLQWVSELNSKFYIPAVPQRKTYVWSQCDVVVSSIDTAKREPHRDIVLDQDYDLIIIDEAHKLKNHKTKNYQFVQSLKKKFCLLLTATPIQNRLSEIFYLVSLLKPGYLGDAESFAKNYKSGSHAVRNEEKLKALVNQVMVRNRREDTGLRWPKRIVKAYDIPFSMAEKDFYDSLFELKERGMIQPFSLLTLQREACSSREAAFTTLNKIYKETAHPMNERLWHHIFEKMNAIKQNAKAKKTLELIQQINDKVIIFTEYRATQLFLQWFLKKNGISSVPFNGGFKRSKKDWMRMLFQNKVQVLVATEAGGEGINLQFACHLINYDLPWNPMRIEQRIGRIHRLGQEKDVHIYNLATRGTVESHILNLLYNKIHLFEQVIGDLDRILTHIDLKDVDKQVAHIFEESESEGEIKVKLDNLSSVINFEQNHLSEGDSHAADGNS